MISFNEEARTHFKTLGCSTALEFLQDIEHATMRASDGTAYTSGLDEVDKLLQESIEVGPPHVILLSDGRPADQEAMLDRFQKILSCYPILKVMPSVTAGDPPVFPSYENSALMNFE